MTRITSNETEEFNYLELSILAKDDVARSWKFKMRKGPGFANIFELIFDRAGREIWCCSTYANGSMNRKGLRCKNIIKR